MLCTGLNLKHDIGYKVIETSPFRFSMPPLPLRVFCQRFPIYFLIRSLFASHFHHRPLQHFTAVNACISFLLSCHNWKMSRVNIYPGCAWSYLPFQHLLFPFDKQAAGLMHIEIPLCVFLKPNTAPPLQCPPSPLLLCCCYRSPTNCSVNSLGEHVFKKSIFPPYRATPELCVMWISFCGCVCVCVHVEGGTTEEVVANPGKYCCFWCVAENPTHPPPPPRSLLCPYPLVEILLIILSVPATYVFASFATDTQLHMPKTNKQINNKVGHCWAVV